MRRSKASEAATALGVSTSTLQKWARGGRVPCDHTAGGHRRYDIDELRRLLDPSDTPPSLDELRRARGAIRRVARRHGLDELQVFGSVARGEAGPGSDVDLVATAGPGCTVLDVMAAEIELEALLGVPVQIITRGTRGVDAMASDAQPL